MTTDFAPFHAHIYYELDDRATAKRLHQQLSKWKSVADPANLLFVGEMRDERVGPHLEPQFEIHFLEDALPRVVPLIEESGLTALVHPLTNDDRADHTSLARWIGKPLELDLTVLDPPGVNQGIARFGASDF